MKYVANPVEVDAFQITVVGDADNFGNFYVGVDAAPSEKQSYKITREMASRMKPDVGDYVVIQSDGYVYLNPKDVFERKYRKA